MALSKDQDPLDQTSDTDIPHVISIASYDTADDENPEPTWDPETTPWIVAVASALEWLDPSEMIRYNHFIIEKIEIFEETDTLRVHTFDTRYRRHRTVDRMNIDIYRTGFEPTPNLIMAARMICQEIETGREIPRPETNH